LDVDVDNLYVKQALANDGPRMKRIRPAPQGRAFRYQRRMSHIVIAVAERKPAGLVTTAGSEVESTAKGKKSAKKSTKPVAKKAPAKKATAKKSAARKGTKSAKAAKKRKRMGHKDHPYGFRLGVTKPGRAGCFVVRDYDKLLIED